MEILSALKAVEATIQDELKSLIDYPKAPYIKFILIATSIEFLGACLDQKEWKPKTSEAENRFNNSLKKLFPKEYHKYAKKDAPISLYEDFRCGMVHKLNQSRNIRLTERRHEKDNDKLHLKEIDNQLVLVLEDFYEDLYKACEKLKILYYKKKLPNRKLEDDYIYIVERNTK